MSLSSSPASSSTLHDEEEQSFMSWVGQTWNSPGFLKSRLVFALVVGTAATIMFAWILCQMERHNATYKAAMLEASIGERDTQLELEEEDDDRETGQDEGRKTNHTSAAATNGNYVNADHGDSHNNNTHGVGVVTIVEQDRPTLDSLYKPGDSRRQISNDRRLQIAAHVGILVLFNYLLLVYLPGGSVVLNLVAVLCLWVLALHSYVRDEVRRHRYDRLVTLVALWFVLAGCLTLATYCRLALKEGSIYQGPARIVGYEDSAYGSGSGNGSETTTYRTDLEVSWGGMWGCPDEGGKVCVATVQGALCDTKTKSAVVESEDGGDDGWDVGGDDGGDVGGDDNVNDEDPNDRRRRRRALKESDAEEEKEIEEKEEADEEVYEEELDEEYEEELEVDEEEVIEEADEEVEEYEEELDEAYEDTIEEEYEGEVEYYEDAVEEEDENEELTEDKTELEDENEQLEEELEEEEDYADELAEEVADLTGESSYGSYSYEDDMFEDDYWEYDWDSVWGDYACEDLFDEDLDGESYNPEVEAGQDEWPTVSIYGSCNSCEAYIMDYYSTDHFMNISLYALQSWIYLMTGFLLLMLSACCAIGEVVRPAKEKEIVLLSHEGGVPA